MEDRTSKLRAMHICRFCLTDEAPLSNIHKRKVENAIPLPLQIMACVDIEVFANDGMPQLICDDCRLQFEKSYCFKGLCKKSDDALKLYLATGVLKKHEKEPVLQNKTSSKMTQDSETQTIEEDRPIDDEPGVKLVEIKPQEEILTKIEVNEDEEIVLTQETDNEEMENVEYLDEAIEEMDISEKPTQVTTNCFSCTECERSFPLQQLLDIHLRQHTRERKFTCKDCEKKFFSKHDLLKHLLVHTNEKPFVCVVCKKRFTRATLLHRHEQTHTSEPKYLCNYCDKTYLTSTDLDNHLQVHKKKRPFKCSQCDKSFVFKQGLERHLANHNVEQMHKCNYCKESFNTPVKLARHVTSHAGTRPFPCKLCPRTFLLSHHLSRHLRNHYNRKTSNNEPGEHKCDFCSMSFRRKDSLVNHTAIHSMVNLKCVICNKEFSDARTVKIHVTTHLAGLPFPCDKCDYSFETQEELEEHEIKHADFDDEDGDEVGEDCNECLLENNSLEIVPSEDGSGPVKLRRSMRECKVVNYSDFLKNSFSSDSDDDYQEELSEDKIDMPVFKPVIRNENVKVYKRIKEKKVDESPNLEQKLQIINLQPEEQQHEEKPQQQHEEKSQQQQYEPQEKEKEKPLEPKSEQTVKTVKKITTLENLGISKDFLESISDKSGIEVKVGHKVIRVKKLMVTKAEYEAMAKEGKIEMRGSTVIVQSPDQKNLNRLSLLKNIDPNKNDEIIDLTRSENIGTNYNKENINEKVAKNLLNKEPSSERTEN